MEFEDFEFFNQDAAPGSKPTPHGAASPLVRLQYLVDNTPAVIYCTVPSGDFKMTFVSNNVVNMLGYRPEEMVADPNFWFDHIHPDDAPAIFSSLAKVFTEGLRAYEYRFRAADGRYLWMHDTLRLISDEQGAPLEVIGALTDITDRKLMEEALQAKGREQQQLIAKLGQAHEQLLQAEKMASIGQLAAGVAHEINNPIGFVNSNMGSLQNYVGTLFRVIKAYEAALADQPALQARLAPLRQEADLDFLEEDTTALVRESMDGLKRVKDIVQSLKDFSHVGENEWQVADLHQGLDSTLNIVANELKYKAEVVREYGQLPPIECLASQLNQVFMNLLVNAGQAIKDKGMIRIRTGAEKGWVWVEIRDSGVGIAPEHLNRIFEPFFTTKPVGSGTGLGLSLSYSIVHKHGGKIDVASQPGKGTAFRILLPQQRPPESKPAATG
ncbi:ATP-binding protein [Massilia sp. BJB1822]|uniref:ATP-binding protein n=1 Tax=Massilia sp. BJB1822 TaxID=2744470 RepID=UPI001593DEF3|nr:ATP-binding protein [Massilia sp. BJB1822]NVE00505.1 PAS domain-containing protein [Massilia sp. BJB1822]